MKRRVEKVFRQLENPPDALLLANATDPFIDSSFFYLFDVPSGLFEGSVAVAFPDGALHVYSSPLEAETAHQAAKDDPSVTIHVAPTSPADPKSLERELAELLRGVSRIGLNFRELTHEWYRRLDKMRPGTTWVDASAGFRKARVTKDAAEVERIRRAAEIGSRVGREIPGWLAEGITELELAAQIEHAMMQAGASGRSFTTIVGFGPKSAEPHYYPQERRLASGDSIVCDFGAWYRRYASDITRSFHFGRHDDEMARVHTTVEAAQAAALEVIRPGVPGKEAHLAAARVIDASPWKGRFTHGLGHSVGLAVHDGYSMGPTTDDPLEEGMVVTVEPGIYLPGRGGVRIEDDILVTKNGYEFLTTTPRGYLEVEA